MELTEREKKIIWDLANAMQNKCLDNHYKQHNSLLFIGDENFKETWLKETKEELDLLQSIKDKMKE